MDHEGSITHWVRAFEAGDTCAAQPIWQHYFERLVSLARWHLRFHARRVADEEDVALSAFNSFFEGARLGRFPELRDRHNLWRTLVLLTARKAIDQIQHDTRKRRGGGRVVGEAGIDGTSPEENGRALEQIIGNAPTPEFAVAVAEEYEHLLRRLGDVSLRNVAQWKMEGFTNEEIAERLDCSLRSVERKLKMVRDIWTGEASRHG